MQQRRGTQMINAMCTVSFRGTLMDHRRVGESVCLIARKDGYLTHPGVQVDRLSLHIWAWRYPGLRWPSPPSLCRMMLQCWSSSFSRCWASSSSSSSRSSSSSWTEVHSLTFPHRSLLLPAMSRNYLLPPKLSPRIPLHLCFVLQQELQQELLPQLCVSAKAATSEVGLMELWLLDRVCVSVLAFVCEGCRAKCVYECVCLKEDPASDHWGSSALSLSLSYSGSFALHSRSVYKNGKESPA